MQQIHYLNSSQTRARYKKPAVIKHSEVSDSDQKWAL